MKTITIILIASLFLIFSPAIEDVSATEYVIRFAHADMGDPLKTSNAAFSEVFKMKVENYTDGRVRVNVYPEGQLGDQMSILQQIVSGDIDMGIVAGGVISSAIYPPLSFESLPYIFPNSVVGEDVLKLDNPLIRGMVEEMKGRSGVGILSIVPIGYRHLTNNRREITSPEDIRGLKIRTMQVRPHMEMINSTGGLAVPIPYLEVYTSLQTGVIDGQENPLSVIAAINLHEVQEYLTLTQHVLHSFFTIYNGDFYHQFPQDIREGIIKAAKEAREAAIGINHIRETLMLEQFERENLKIYVPTREELEEFIKVMQPAGIKWYKNTVPGGDVILSELFKEIEKAQEKYR